MKVLGVDPGGVHAAAAILEDGRLIYVADVPIVDKLIDAAAFARVVDIYQPDVAVIENVGAFPGQGVSSAFKFGQGLGLLRGVIIGAGIPYHLVAATKWKKSLGLDSDAEKSRAMAIRLWPASTEFGLKKSHNKAEAALIAYAWEKMQ